MSQEGRPWHGGTLYHGKIFELPQGYRTGDGVFETIRTYEGVPFRLHAHLERLVRGARLIGIKETPSPNAIEKEVQRSLEAARANAPPGEWILRPVIFADGSGWGFATTAERYSPPTGGKGNAGLRIGTSSYPHPGPFLLPPGGAVQVKWISRGPLAHALREAHRRGWEEALLCDHEGRVIEGTRSNIFAYIDGVLVSPGGSSGALDGITRETVVECASEKGMVVIDNPIKKSRLLRAKEVFLTSTLLGVAGVSEIDGRKVCKAGTAGPLTEELSTAFQDKVRSEISVKG